VHRAQVTAFPRRDVALGELALGGRAAGRDDGPGQERHGGRTREGPRAPQAAAPALRGTVRTHRRIIPLRADGHSPSCRGVTPLDWFIVAFTVGLALLGLLRGFIVGALSLAGLLGGAFLGTRLAPEVLEGGSASPWAPLFALGGAVLGGALLAGGLGGVGERLRARIRHGGAAGLDGALGALLSAAVALAMVWIVGAVVLQAPGTEGLRGEVQRSFVLQRLNAVLPPSGPVLNALARFDPFPSLRGPSADVPAPRAAIARDPDVRAASDSVVRVLGSACGLGVSGSGWVAAEGLVVTNAHVVAGQDDTTVQLGGDGPRLEAQAVAFDAHDDVAVLRVPGLRARPLAFAPEAPSGTRPPSSASRATARSPCARRASARRAGS
jgi:hypothetical protein